MSKKISSAFSEVVINRPLKPPGKWKYRRLTTVGKGAFGVVYSSMNADGKIVAVKRVKANKNGLERELKVLQVLNSPFCLKLLDHYIEFSEEDNENYLYLVTELMPESLGKTIRFSHQMKEPLPPLLVKLYLYQLFAGLAHIHSLGIVHRDIKTDNCLVDRVKGILKIIDFGSSKFLTPGMPNSCYIASRIYRAPELLLDCTTYDYKIDIWAAGCVAAEVILDAIPMFQGSCNADHLIQIMKVLGRPTQDDIESFEHPIPFPECDQICTLENALPLGTDKDLLELLQRIFVYNPSLRPTAEECMKSRYFDELFMEGKTLPNGNRLPELPRV